MNRLSPLICMVATAVSSFALESFIDPTVYHNQFGSYYVPNNQGNRPGIMRIKRGDVHELKTLTYIQDIYEEGTSMIHAGTYFGDMLPFFSRLLGENTLWAFEPVRESYICAVANVKLNNLKNVNIFNKGLSNKKNSLSMEVKTGCSHHGGASRIVGSNRRKHPGLETIQVDSIDNILSDNKEKISIIHLDIEGHEKIALAGAKNTIKTYRPVIILEVTSKQLKTMQNHMAKLGYKFEKRIDNNCVYFPTER